jgi:methylenetetrahydrofolate dehydrogenase (NADP+) / methenyltetrahydrofolate cyclohydrolase
MKSLVSKQLLERLRAELKASVAQMVDRGIEPHVAAVLVGDDEWSLKYVDLKTKAALELGITFSLYHIALADAAEIESTMKFLADDEEVHGIILQLPLPDELAGQTDHLVSLIPAAKDVDGLRGEWKTLKYTRYTTESLLANQPYALPPMVGSVTALLNEYDIALEDKKIVMVGNGRLVGQPLNDFYTKLGMNAVTVDELTEGILDIAKTADILVSGTGQHDLITYQWVKEGATVIDCAADVHVDSVSQVAEALSPSVGGVGPLTVFWLLHNTVQAARNQS